MRRTLFRACAFLLIAGLTAYGLGWGGIIEVVFHEETSEFADMARSIRIRNLVTLVYLGPRLADTLLEVLVVVLAVQGLRYAGEEA